MTDKLPWLALKSIPGVGPVLFQRLLARFGTPAAVFQARCEDLLAIKGVNRDLARDILGFRDWDRVEAELANMAAAGVEVLLQTDPRFPARLKQIPYPPPLLFLKGTLLPQDDLALALVGTRAASYYGLKTCRRLAGALAVRGVTVVSGLARGIDTAAHQGALENSGRTLAVLGCGLDVVYPPENQKLYEQIPEQGALISEFPLSTPPEAKNFPIRNRIISGLSLGVVVVEAGLEKRHRHHGALRPGPGPGGLRGAGADRFAHQPRAAPPHPGRGQAGPGPRGHLLGAAGPEKRPTSPIRRPGRVRETPAAEGGGPTPATVARLRLRSSARAHPGRPAPGPAGLRPPVPGRDRPDHPPRHLRSPEPPHHPGTGGPHPGTAGEEVCAGELIRWWGGPPCPP